MMLGVVSQVRFWPRRESPGHIVVAQFTNKGCQLSR